ncbi:ABC transporter ATP-binding protein [Ensifer adhaerens]
MTVIPGPFPPVLEVEDLCIAYADSSGERRAVHDVSFRINPGEVVALVGESGSGKTTTAQSIIGLLAANGRVERGTIKLNGTDIARWTDRQLDTVRGARISLVPQDPGSSLNPVKTIGSQLGEMFRIHGALRSDEIEAQVLSLLARVGLSEPALRARQYPHELSGGMRQRVLIAIAIALKPQLIIADEPTSALDVTVQKRILDLIDELRTEYGTAVLLVTHDLGVAADRADRIVVLQGGRLQEQGATGAVLAAPRSPYTKQLLSDAPSFTAPPEVGNGSTTRCGGSGRYRRRRGPCPRIRSQGRRVPATRRRRTELPRPAGNDPCNRRGIRVWEDDDDPQHRRL